MIRLIKEANNLYMLQLDDLTIWFSYETPIAFEKSFFYIDEVEEDDKVLKRRQFEITKNIWSNTTGKHLNMIDPDKSKRIDYAEFIKLLEKALQ